MPPQKRVLLPNGCYAYEDTPNSADILYQQVLEYFDQGLDVMEGMTVFDVGANVGLFALEALYRTNGRIRIFCFEPAPAAFGCLRRSLTEQFAKSDIKALNVGLSSSPGHATLFYRRQASAMSSFDAECVLTEEDMRRLASTAASTEIPREYRRRVPWWFAWLPNSIRRLAIRHTMRRVVADVEPVTCELTTLGDVIREHDVARIDVLKIDVEGAEWEVLQGVGPDDWPKIRSLAIEVHDIHDRLRQVENLLQERGFTDLRIEQEAIFRGTSVFGVCGFRNAAD